MKEKEVDKMVSFNLNLLYGHGRLSDRGSGERESDDDCTTVL